MKLREKIEQLKIEHQREVMEMISACQFPFHFYMDGCHYRFLDKGRAIKVSIGENNFWISNYGSRQDELGKFFGGYYEDSKEITELEFQEKLHLAKSLI